MFVPVESEAQALELYEAGLLWLNYSSQWPRPEDTWKVATDNDAIPCYIELAFRNTPHPTQYLPPDFAYYLED